MNGKDGPQYVDISVYQPLDIDWALYKKWSSQWDGIARVAIRSTYGTGYTDQHFQTYREGALSAGIGAIYYYHYAYPQLNHAWDEADWQARVVGAVRATDLLMLDYEEEVTQATAEWAHTWMARQTTNYAGKLPLLYASSSYITHHLQDVRLAQYPLVLANWQFSPLARPACPLPWVHYYAVQYTDRAVNIPGILSPVDANVYIGGGVERNTIHMDQQKKDIWNMFLEGIGQPTVSYTTGIALSWQRNYTKVNAGSPVGPEKHSVDWGGNSIQIQYFSGGVRCEWNNTTGTPAWYDYANRRVA